MPYLINVTGTTDGYQKLGSYIYDVGSDTKKISYEIAASSGVLLTSVTGLYETRFDDVSYYV